MNYDRQITISVGNNRRDMVWKQTVLTVEELYKRLSTPVRGTETLQDYLHLKKSQQDDTGQFDPADIRFALYQRA